jgi:hypothetical protein
MIAAFLLVLLLPLAYFLSEGNWRDALLYSVVIGFLQDPLRKITPDQPALYAGVVLVAISLTVAVLYSRIGRVSLVQLFNGDRQLVSLIELLLGLLLLQTINSFLNLDSWFRTLLGLGFYAAPLMTLWLGFQFALKPSSVRRFLWIYVIMALLFTFTFFLDYRGYQGPLFEEIAGGAKVLIAEVGGYTAGYTGFWRNTEVAAWHLATCACFVFILAVQRREPLPIALGSALVLTLMVIGTLTGRRKGLTLVVGFLAFFGLLIAWRGDKGVRGKLVAGLIGGAILLISLSNLGGNPLQEGTLSAFVGRSQTVWNDIFGRLFIFGSGTILLSLEGGGILGAGVGAAAQGAGSLGLKAVGNFGGAEGGLGKISAELGLAGIGLFLFILILIARLYWRAINQLRYAPPAYGLMNLGLIAFIAANVLNFTAASQVYGDPFVLIIVGLCAGYVLGSLTVMRAHLRAQRQMAEGLAPVSPPVLPPPAPPRVSRP